MSAHDDNHAHSGGHELDSFDKKILFKLVFGLSALVVFSCILVAEWFYRQHDAIQDERAAQEKSFILRTTVREEMKAETKDLDKVIDAMVAAPKLIEGQKPPEGWVHPDDVSQGE